MSDQNSESPETLSRIYMEICAALMSQIGEIEVQIDAKHFPVGPFSLWRRWDDDVLTVRVHKDDAKQT